MSEHEPIEKDDEAEAKRQHPSLIANRMYGSRDGAPRNKRRGRIRRLGRRR